MAGIYKCPKCGTACLTDAEAKAHCAGGNKCRQCNGLGYKLVVGGPNITCTACRGSGVV